MVSELSGEIRNGIGNIEVNVMAYCKWCGGTGIDIDGNVCSCRINVKSFYDTVSCLDVPEQYRGISFNKSLVPKDLPEAYADFLQSIHDKVFEGKLENYNVLIASPVGHSKTILSYSCLELLFRNGFDTFPVYDVLELKRMLIDMDLCRKSIYEIENPELIMTVPILFVKIPRVSSWEVYDTITLILDRRVRRGNSTIFTFDGTWGELVYNDKRNILAGLVGDGNYNTLKVSSWKLPEVQEERKIVIPENVG